MSNQDKSQTEPALTSEAERALADELHHSLFPEEYDLFYDSSSEATMRRRGANPMSAAYVAKTNMRRKALGFAPFQVERVSSDTRAWVWQKIVDGHENDLRNAVAARAAEDKATDEARSAERKLVQTEKWITEQIDTALASNCFVPFEPDAVRDDPFVVAFRLLGAIYDMNPTGPIDTMFARQIRRLIPGKSSKQYEALYQHALQRWSDLYCE